VLASGGSCVAGPGAEWVLAPSPGEENPVLPTLDLHSVAELPGITPGRIWRGLTSIGSVKMSWASSGLNRYQTRQPSSTGFQVDRRGSNTNSR